MIGQGGGCRLSSGLDILARTVPGFCRFPGLSFREVERRQRRNVRSADRVVSVQPISVQSRAPTMAHTSSLGRVSRARKERDGLHRPV